MASPSYLNDWLSSAYGNALQGCVVCWVDRLKSDDEITRVLAETEIKLRIGDVRGEDLIRVLKDPRLTIHFSLCEEKASG